MRARPGAVLSSSNNLEPACAARLEPELIIANLKMKTMLQVVGRECSVCRRNIVQGLLESVFRGKEHSFVEHSGKKMIANGLFLGKSRGSNWD